MPDLDQELGLIVKDKPWLHPDLQPESWWIVTSEPEKAWVIGDGYTAPMTMVRCLSRVSFEDGSPAFVYDNCVVSVGNVAHAYQVLLVRADDPHRAGYDFDQDDVDAAFRATAP